MTLGGNVAWPSPLVCTAYQARNHWQRLQCLEIDDLMFTGQFDVLIVNLISLRRILHKRAYVYSESLVSSSDPERCLQQSEAHNMTVTYMLMHVTLLALLWKFNKLIMVYIYLVTYIFFLLNFFQQHTWLFTQKRYLKMLYWCNLIPILGKISPQCPQRYMIYLLAMHYNCKCSV